jgi:hypothetical protein
LLCRTDPKVGPSRFGPVFPSLELRTRRFVSRDWVPWVHSSQLRPRLWHKVEHVHPGALRGRAVGSAPGILRMSGTVPLLHFSLGFKDSETPLAHLPLAHRSALGFGSLPPSSFLSPLPCPPRAAYVQPLFAHTGTAEAFPALTRSCRFRAGFHSRATRRVALEPCTQTRRSGR